MKRNILLFLMFLLPAITFCQEVDPEPSIYDYGKMWTFENAPTEYFQKTYGFEADERWLSKVRKSSLKFATWCSASFVSPNGLIMTNHHCSNGEMPKVMKDGEDFNSNGFYAKTMDEERKIDGLFVEQLLMMKDVTEEIKGGKSSKEVQELYAEKDEWKGLRLQVVSYYSGSKYSLYGYKVYNDIRLVFIPELQLGFYGGDPDNFTFPRYNLDCTFWRAYDENGKPADTGAYYFKFNPEGAAEGEAVFVVGNPGSTERYRTVSQLEYDRDYRYNILLESLTVRHDELKADYEKDPSPELLDQIFGLSNSMKAIGGIVKGLHDPVLFGRKQKMEEQTRKAYKGDDHWTALDKAYEELEPYAMEINLLSPSGLNGGVMGAAHQLYAYDQMINSTEEVPEEDMTKQLDGLKEALAGINANEIFKFGNQLARVKKLASKDDKFIGKLLGGKDPMAFAKALMEDSKLLNSKKLDKALSAKKFKKSKDPLKMIAATLVPAYNESVSKYRGSSKDRRALEEQVAKALFEIHGENLPPDATFTLRISDGVVKSYNYNGTKAPYKTTYYGLYDRHYSHEGDPNWALPKKWMNPPAEMLNKPLNFVSTNDIIGGNSGSAIINSKGEAVGLIFDGNIESLPGNFIYEPTLNRAVSVHAGGIAAALEYIYKADRLVKELVGK